MYVGCVYVAITCVCWMVSTRIDFAALCACSRACTAGPTGCGKSVKGGGKNHGNERRCNGCVCQISRNDCPSVNPTNVCVGFWSSDVHAGGALKGVPGHLLEVCRAVWPNGLDAHARRLAAAVEPNGACYDTANLGNVLMRLRTRLTAPATGSLPNRDQWSHRQGLPAVAFRQCSSQLSAGGASSQLTTAGRAGTRVITIVYV